MGFLSSLFGTDEPTVFKLIKNGDIDGLKKFGYFDHNQIYYYQPMIYYAVENTKMNLYSIVEYLIKAGCNVDDRDQFGAVQETPLSRVCHCSHPNVEVARLLLKNGAKVNTRGKNGSCALHGTAFSLNIEVLDLLKEYNANFNIPDWHGRTTLHHLAFHENHEDSETEYINKLEKYIGKMIKYGADINIKDDYGDTPVKLIGSFNKLAYQVIKKYC